MSKKHDERKCVRSLSKVCRFDGKFIIANTSTTIGIHKWGMIDYLVKYCGYFFHTTNSRVTASNISFSDDGVNSVREAKKARKEHKLTNKKR